MAKQYMMKNREIAWEKILIGIGISALAYYVWLIFQDIYIAKDGALYLTLARSLASGEGYVDSFLPEPLPHTFVPPGYPFLLSLIIRAVGFNILYLRAANVIFAATSLAILVKILGRYMKTRELIVVFSLFAFNTVFVSLVNSIDSDMPYLLFLFLSLLIFETGGRELPVNKFLIGAAAIIAAFYMRMVGLALYCSALIYLLIRHKRREFFMLIILGIFILPWCGIVLSGFQGYHKVFLMQDVHLSSGGLIQIADMPIRVLTNMKYYSGKIVADLVFGPFSDMVTFGNPLFPIKICLSLLFSALFFAGFIRSAQKKIGFINLYVAVYISGLMLWSYHSTRFLIPVYPFLLGYMIDAFRSPRIKYIKLPLVSILLCSVIMANLGTVKNFMEKRESPERSAFEIYDWLKNNTPPGAIIMSSEPASIYLYSQRKAASWYMTRDADDFFDRVKKNKVDYILVDRKPIVLIRGRKINKFDDYFKAVIEKYPGCFELVHQSRARPEIMVYRISGPLLK
jgi:hypothetical protein